jgi:uncharacterized membrane protein
MGPHGHGHAHGHGHGDPELDLPDQTRRVLTVVAVALAVLTVLGMFVLRPTGEDRPDLSAVGGDATYVDARLISLEEFGCPGAVPDEELRCASATFEILEGSDTGLRTSQELFDLDSLAPLTPGDKVVMRFDAGAPPGFEYQFSGDRQRKPALAFLALLFAGTVILLGRWKGVAALAGLLGSLAVLLGFILPAIIDGRSPLPVAIVGASAIAFLALYLAHGFTPMTTIALFGTLSSLALTAVLGVVFVDLAAFSGLANEDAYYLKVAAGTIDVRGLVLAGIVIGALGAIDDMSVTQASAVWELHAANPQAGRRGLYRSAMTIGRDHVASTVNTLVLAYAGASMPLLILFVLGSGALADVANTEIVATEIVRTLVGSMGLVVAVPVTTWLATWVAPRTADPDADGPREAGRFPQDREVDADADVVVDGAIDGAAHGAVEGPAADEDWADWLEGDDEPR